MTTPMSPRHVLAASTHACIDALRHAAGLRAATGKDRTLRLPALRVTMAALGAALDRHRLTVTGIAFDTDPGLDVHSGSQPPLATPAADRLGFRHDGDLHRIVPRGLG